jgi:hypothetical protein
MRKIIGLLILSLLIFYGGSNAMATEKEDAQKDLQIMSLTVEKNLYQNEFLTQRIKELQQKIQAIEAKEKAEVDKKAKEEKK